MMIRLKKVLLNIVKFAVIFVCLYYLYRKFSESFASLGGVAWEKIHYLPLCGAIVAYASFFAVKVANWWYILRLFKVPVSFSFSSGIWFGSQTIKYIPGKVWFLLGRFYFGRKKISKSLIFVATSIELVMMLLSALVVFLIFGLDKDVAQVSRYVPATPGVLGLVAVFLFAIHPRVLEWGIGFLAKLGKSERQTIDIDYGKLFLLLTVYVLNWLFFGFANYVLISVFKPISFSLIGLICAVFAISYVIGFLSFITPGGIGVRESVQVYFLSTVIAGHTAVLISVFSRILWMLMEIIGTAIFLGIRNLLLIKRDSLIETR